MHLIDPNHPFYRPLWRRVLIVAACLGWAVVEASTRQPFWAVIVGGMGIYAGWMLLLNFDPKPPEEPAATVVDDDDNDERRDG
jgi:hypothetical protein